MEYRAKIPFFRSSNNSDDYATTIDVIEKVIKEYQDININFDYACYSYSYAPFIGMDKLKESFFKLEENKYNCIFPIVCFSFLIQRAVRINKNDKINMF